MSNSQADRLAEQPPKYSLTVDDCPVTAAGIIAALRDGDLEDAEAALWIDRLVHHHAALAKQQASPITYHRDDEGHEAIEAYAKLIACLGQDDIRRLANWLAHGARATLGDGCVTVTREDWTAIEILKFATPPSAPQCEQAVPIKEIGDLLADAMNQAVANGANSVSMPDEYVAIAGWLAGNNVGAATEQAPVTSIEPVRPLISRLMVLRVLLAERYPEHHATVFEAINAIAQGTTPAAGADAWQELVQKFGAERAGMAVSYLLADEEMVRQVAAGVGEQATGGEHFNIALNTMHKRCHEAADAFWNYWNENGETHKHGYYESTWGAINRALRMVGVKEHNWSQK